MRQALERWLHTDRLLDGDVAQRLLAAVVAQPRVQALMSDEHFSVNGTLMGA